VIYLFSMQLDVNCYRYDIREGQLNCKLAHRNVTMFIDTVIAMMREETAVRFKNHWPSVVRQSVR
jgi:hypothetical protein